jgi:hypothetical protein
MRTRRPFAIPIGIVASLALTTAVLAGGWASVTITDPPADPTAGGETIFDLTVMQHGVTPVSWPAITVVATNAETGATVSGVAKASGAVGHYTVGLTFPTDGAWTIAFASNDLIMEGGQTLAVSAAAPAAASQTTAAGAVDVSMLTVLLMLVLAFVGAIGVMLVRDRRAAGSGGQDEGAPATTTTG